MRYECAIVGGGIAGLQAAIQMGRYEHRVLVIDSGYGRSTLCRAYHNVLGWPDGVSGDELRRLGRQQAERYGVVFADDEVVKAQRIKGGADGFRLEGNRGDAPAVYEADVVLLATGLLDRFPDLPGLVPCLGLTVYVCPDCDSYEVRQRTTVVLGGGDVGARMALLLRERTPYLTYVNHERAPVDGTLAKRLADSGIDYREEPIREVLTSGDGQIRGLRLEGGDELKAERGFLAFGGNEVKSELAHQLGVERHENGHIYTDPRSKMTNVQGVWAAGDIGVHSEQVTVAMGDGAQAAIWMHKALVELKKERAAAVPV